MLTRTSLALVGTAAALSALVACSATNPSEGLRDDGSGANGSGNGGSTLNLGGNGAGSNVGGLDSGGQGALPMVPCDEATPCADGNVCATGSCAPDLGPCSGDEDCGGDSYCCGEGCRDDGGEPVCIPYGYGPRGTLNPSCKGAGEPGVFAPSVQCEWLGPAASDPYPDSKKVLTSPLSANLPNDSGASAEIVVLTYGGADGSFEAPGVIRILNGQTCELLESISDETDVVRANATPALADLDNNGAIEIVTRREGGGAVAFEWDGAQYVKKWAATTPALAGGQQKWDGPSIHDLNDDGLPEVMVQSAVYDGQTGAVIDDDSFTLSDVFNGMIPVLGDFDADGQVELVAPRWNELTFWGWNGQNWIDEGLAGGLAFNLMASHYAVADFGTPGASASEFDWATLDGIAEIVAVLDMPGRLTIHTLQRHLVFDVATGRGGPPTIADFDNDGLPEIAVAGATEFSIYDPDCLGGGAGCQADGVRWSQPSQDSSSAQTGVAVFDFDGDGQAEAVYADECFLRVYDGQSGEVLYSAYRTSGTWYESPLVADVDNDQNTEIVVNNNVGAICPVVGGALDVPYVDPLHPGVRCDDDAGCVPGGSCGEGFCRCTGDADCDVGMTCVAPIAGTPGSGDVCRATHPNKAEAAGGIRVLRDRLDRWASSRPIWNQHAYSITNVNDDGTIPRTSEWLLNWTQPGLNNYRQNVQGSAGFEDYPDITGALSEDDVCIVSSGGDVTLTATVCNRGAKAVGADMPATFYQGQPADGVILCVSYTEGPVPVEGCLQVSCTIEAAVTGQITMVVNDNGGGGQTTVECNSDNNQDTVSIESCVVK